MAATIAPLKRSTAEKVFIFLFLPTVFLFYLIYKYPTLFVPADNVADTFYWFGKSTSFWYSTLYTAIVIGIAGKVVLQGSTPYGKNKQKKISSYQRNKFISIFVSQLLFFYLIPFIFPFIFKGGEFFNDQYSPVNKNAYVYVYNGFTSLGGFAYIFVVVPLSVYFLGKRYCSWFCACGNLAEVIGVTKWGNQWVQKKTPRGEKSEKWEPLQYVFLFLALCFGLLLLLDGYKVISAGNIVEAWRAFQDLVVDLIFGALVGVGAYPFLGTRIWCRYGCPLAGGMKLFGKYFGSKFKVVADDSCKGLNLCTLQCPMGIQVDKYAHENKKPIEGSFGLVESPCVGCGGCIDICPVQALSFKEILNKPQL